MSQFFLDGPLIKDAVFIRMHKKCYIFRVGEQSLQVPTQYAKIPILYPLLILSSIGNIYNMALAICYTGMYTYVTF